MRQPHQRLFSISEIALSLNQLNKSSEAKMGISLVQWCFLKKLVDLPAAAPHQLADSTGVNPASLTQTLKRLERKNYIYMTTDSKDSRKKIVVITRQGKSALDRSDVYLEFWSENLKGLDQEILKLSMVLKKQITGGD